MINYPKEKMAILIANIGTSDLAVKLSGFEYYLSIFEREEPNEERSELTNDEIEIWGKRNSYIAEILCDQLNVKVTKTIKGKNDCFFDFSFRELSDKLLQAYIKDSDTWHPHIRPCRIGGTILEAKEQFEVQAIHLFLTDQHPPHKLDTVYLFELLKRWFDREYNLTLTAQAIPLDIPANDSDKLLDYYHNFFNKNISSDSTVLVSIKGGTPQMQTALKMQAIASSVSRLMFIDPQFSISKTLAGQFSDCNLTSYWRYMRTQKYQTVKLLLEKRLDFNGAIQILADWKEVLNFFKEHKVVGSKDIDYSNEAISRVIKTLDIGINCFNLDIQAAKSFLQANSQLQLSSKMVNEVRNYDRLLNLYTQCRIYWKLGQIANFLSRMSSFYEGVIEEVARKLGWFQDYQQLNNRFEKRNWVDNKVRSRNIQSQLTAWTEVLDLLRTLDYWCSQRNKIIHSAEGVSLLRMQELYKQEYRNNSDVCQPEKITENMAKILRSNLQIVKNEYSSKFVGENAQYYIYSEVKDWVIETLMTVGLR